MFARSANHALALLVAVAASAASAQTIEERAARVRQTLASPPPLETVIDRGTRVLGQPAAAAISAVAPKVDPRLITNSIAPAFDAIGYEASGYQASGSANPQPVSGAPGLTNTATSRGAAFVNDPRGTGFLNDTRGTAVQGSPELTGGVGVRGAMPGLTVIRQPGDDQVTGTANLVTGTGRTPGLAP
jgi:hypothetical protein